MACVRQVLTNVCTSCSNEYTHTLAHTLMALCVGVASAGKQCLLFSSLRAINPPPPPTLCALTPHRAQSARETIRAAAAKQQKARQKNNCLCMKNDVNNLLIKLYDSNGTPYSATFSLLSRDTSSGARFHSSSFSVPTSATSHNKNIASILNVKLCICFCHVYFGK